jgi:hypothetical protein
MKSSTESLASLINLRRVPRSNSRCIKVDQDLPRQIADIAVAHSHGAVTVVGQGWQGVPDDVLWSRTQDERRWLITADKGIRRPPSAPTGKSRGFDLAAVTRRELPRPP